MHQTLGLNSIAAVQTFASHIEGHGDPMLTLAVRRGHEPALEVLVAGNRSYTELRFPGASTITIIRPGRHSLAEGMDPATVTWSSSDSRGSDPALTAMLLNFAAKVADRLNEWADRGELPRLAQENTERAS